ncbi:glycosyltransferase family 4 protein [Dechloromonas sp. XY25]|uniref:Glycosyltransferase family 4 protein n=1 Tax=Dechloromonas hankyongensis TaxID=2908002 RepID=A0ABS9K6B1_9RHOO|nr:glycosyltransferase family 4 protein [Dechloromonas hankyongensis]MCG2578615.1 glycosyltransferase family 4 protein [Dechloromonas hankyongensis]
MANIYLRGDRQPALSGNSSGLGGGRTQARPETNTDKLRPSAGKRVLILVENLPSPFDRRVWQEATTLRAAGYQVTIICPTGRGYEKKFEIVEQIHIHRYHLPVEAEGPLGYALEYTTALLQTFLLSWKVFVGRGFDVIHACNPPDLFFLIGIFFKAFGKKFLFDHHDINPELYEAKFGRRDTFYRLLLRFERWSFKTADVSIATNQSYRCIAIERGGMSPDRVFVVRSGPSLERLRIGPPHDELKRGRRYLVGYVGVMGKQEGIDHLLHAVHHIVYVHRRQDIHFGLVGGGTSLEAMKKLAASLGVADYVTFTGRVSDEEMLAMLNTADVCVNPDTASAMNDKSTMNKIMEYMALGKPIVQFDLTEGRFSAQESSLYAEPDDSVDLAAKLVFLLDDEALRQRMGTAGRQRVLNELAWHHEVPKLLAAYQTLWQGQEGSSPASRVAAP